MNIFKNGVGRPSNNIKRARVIIAVIAVILSATIGYALFSQQVKVTGTATASGTFQITTTCIPTTNELKTAYSDMRFEEDITSIMDKGVNSSSCTVSNGNVIYSASLAYPSAMSVKFFETKNTGTIAAKYTIDDVEIDKTYCKTVNSVENCNWDGKAFNDRDDNYALETDLMFVAFKKSDNTIIYFQIKDETKDNYFYNFEDDEAYVTLNPGESVIWVVSSRWNEKSGTEGNNLSYKSQIEIEMPFLQAN